MVGIALKMACTATKFRSLSVRVEIKQTKTAGKLVLSRTRRCTWIRHTPIPSPPTSPLNFPSSRSFAATPHQHTQIRKNDTKSACNFKHNFGVLWCCCACALFLGIMSNAAVTILSDNYGFVGCDAPCRFARSITTFECGSVVRTKG